VSAKIRRPSSGAIAGFAVTVIVHTLNATTGRPRYLLPTEPAEWARAIFSTVDSTHGYVLGAVDPDTGDHRRQQFAYRLYLDADRQAIPVPRRPRYLPSTAELRSPIPLRPDPAIMRDLISGVVVRTTLKAVSWISRCAVSP
jgi:hypothetical protein